MDTYTYYFSSWRALLKSYTEQGCYLDTNFFVYEQKRTTQKEHLKIVKRILKDIRLGKDYYLAFLFKDKCFIGKLIEGNVYALNDPPPLEMIIFLTLEMDDNEHENLTKTMRSAYLDISLERIQAIDKSNPKRNWKAEAWDINGFLFKTEEKNLEDIKNLGCAYLVLNERV